MIRRPAEKRKRKRKRIAMEKQKTTAADEEEEHMSKLPDDLLVQILSLCNYRTLMRTVSVSKRWERLLSSQLPDLTFCLSLIVDRTPSKSRPSEERAQSMARTLRRRCRDRDTADHHAIRMLRLVYRKDVAMECRYADDMIALANATKLVVSLHMGVQKLSPDADAGAWSLQLPPATAELQVEVCDAVRPPRIHGAGVNALRSLTLLGYTVVREDFPLTATMFPTLEDLHIGNCTLAASMSVSSDTMPRLKHLRFTDVSVRTDDTKAAITVLAGDLRTLRMSCRWYSKTASPSEPLSYLCHSGATAVFTKYSLFRLRAPKLAVFEWRCCYADQVRVEAVGRLSYAAIEVAAGRTPTPMPIGTEPKYVTTQQRDKLMTDILQGLMPGLQPHTWKDVTRKCKQLDDRWLFFESTSAYPATE